MQKHILFVLDYFWPHKGGAETVFENVIKRLVDKGYKITVLTSYFDKELKKHEAVKLNGSTQNIDIYRAGNTRLGFLWKGFWAGRKIIKEAKKNNTVDIIHTSTYGGALPAWFLGKVFNKKVILTVHEVFGKLRYLYKGKFVGFWFLLFEKIIFAFKYNYYHCVSRYTMNSLRLMYGVDDAKLRTIYNGIDTEFRNIDNVDKKNIAKFKQKHQLNDSFVCLYYGHTGKSKGLDYLIQAIPEIMHNIQNNNQSNKQNLQLVFNLIPAERDQICKSEIQKQIQKLPKTDQNKVHVFNGMPIKELRELVASCDVVIAPSLSEGFGSVHTEATAMDKILITTEIGPLPEVLSGKVIFIRPQNPQAIVKAIDTARNGNIEKIPKKNFSWDVCVEKIEEVYGAV